MTTLTGPRPRVEDISERLRSADDVDLITSALRALWTAVDQTARQLGYRGASPRQTLQLLGADPEDIEALGELLVRADHRQHPGICEDPGTANLT